MCQLRHNFLISVSKTRNSARPEINCKVRETTSVYTLYKLCLLQCLCSYTCYLDLIHSITHLMSLTNPLKPTLTSLIEEHNVDIEIIPDFYLHTFAYLLGGESIVLEGFPVNLSIALFDIFVLEQAKCFKFEHSINLVFLGSDSRKISKLSSLSLQLLTTKSPTTAVIEVNAQDLLHLNENSHSNLKNLSVSLVLYQISSDLIATTTFPPSWQVIILPLSKVEGLLQNVSINFLKIAQSDDIIRFERLQEDFSIKPQETPQNHTTVNIEETSQQAQSLCKDHGFPTDMNDILLPTLIYILLRQNVIMHTYSDISFIHVVGILASIYQTGEYGKLIICIQNEENRRNLIDFKPSIRFTDIGEKQDFKINSNFLIDASQLTALKSSRAFEGYTGILAVLSSEAQLPRHIVNLPTNYTLLIGTSYYSSDLLKIMTPFRFVLFSGYPICPARVVGNNADEFKLLDLPKLPSISSKPRTNNRRNKSKKNTVPVPLVPTFTESRFSLEEHSNILLTSLLQANLNLLVQYTSSFDYDTYFKYLVSRVEKDSDTPQVIIHGEALYLSMVFEQFSTSNNKYDCRVFCYCGGKVSSLKAILITHKIQILFIPTNELILLCRSVDILFNCKVLVYLATGWDNSSTQLHNPLTYLHYEAQLVTQIVVVFKGDCGVVSNFINTPFCHVQESNDLTKERFSINFCNYF